MRRRPPPRSAFRPAALQLEDRTLLSVAFQIDYSLDTNHFFDTQAKKDLLQLAADTIGTRLNDSLMAIQRGGENTWTALPTNPATGAVVSIDNPTIPANTILVFAGGRPLSGSELGTGGPGGFNSTGTPEWNDLVGGRGQPGALAASPTDFGPWGGSVAFDTNANWYFGTAATGQGPGQADFLSVALHEMAHLIGFGTASSWKALTFAGRFLGRASNAAYDGPGLLTTSPDGGHWAQGTTDGGFEADMEPSLLDGTRKLLTRLDFAGLQDVGWTVGPDPDGTIGLAGPPVLSGFDIKTISGGKLGPDRTDVDMVHVVGTAGSVLTVTTQPRLGGTSVDTLLRLFNSAGQELASANTGIYDTLSFRLPADDSYYVGISGAGNATYSPVEDLARRIAGPTGDYDLQLRLGPPSGVPTADLVVQVSAPPSDLAGSPMVFTATVANRGPDAAPTARLAVALPASATYLSALSSGSIPVTLAGGIVTAQFGTLLSGQTGTVQITVLPSTVATLTFSALAASAQVDPVSSNSSAAAATAVSSPPPVDTTPPTVLGDARIVATRKGAKRKTSFLVTFSEAVDAAQAQDLGNFLLTRPGKARRRRPIPRIRVALKSASYDARSHVVTLVPAIKGAIPRGLRLTLAAGPPHPGIHDLAGNALDGNGDGAAGGDAELNVR